MYNQTFKKEAKLQNLTQICFSTLTLCIPLESCCLYIFDIENLRFPMCCGKLNLNQVWHLSFFTFSEQLSIETQSPSPQYVFIWLSLHSNITLHVTIIMVSLASYHMIILSIIFYNDDIMVDNRFAPDLTIIY